MSQRDSGYQRRPADHYPTPAWVASTLAGVIGLRDRLVWEPAAGSGEFADALEALTGRPVIRSDIRDCSPISLVHDFANNVPLYNVAWDAIITNPPYGHSGLLAEAFIRRGVGLLAVPHTWRRWLALLLPTDFDAAKSRFRYFGGCPQFAGRITLLQRVKWFDHPVPCKRCGGTGRNIIERCRACHGKGEKRMSPSVNHAWFLWSDHQQLHPFVAYAPHPETAHAPQSPATVPQV